jgi:hypothetical protein
MQPTRQPFGLSGAFELSLVALTGFLATPLRWWWSSSITFHDRLQRLGQVHGIYQTTLALVEAEKRKYAGYRVYLGDCSPQRVATRQDNQFDTEFHKVHTNSATWRPQPKCVSPIIDGEQRHAMAAVAGILLDTLQPAWGVSSEDQQGAFASVPRLLGHPEVETQMHTDKKGWTRMARLRGHRVGPEPMPVQPAFCVIRSYPRRSAFPLSCPGGIHAPGWRKVRQTGKRRRQTAVEHVRSLCWSGRLGA